MGIRLRNGFSLGTSDITRSSQRVVATVALISMTRIQEPFSEKPTMTQVTSRGIIHALEKWVNRSYVKRCPEIITIGDARI